MDTKFSVALHMLIYISETQNEATSQQLATSVNTNSSHIRKISVLLKQEGLINSFQGKSGFVLAKPSNEITLADIYYAVYKEKHILHVHGHPNLECPVGANIKPVIEPIFNKTQQVFMQELKQITLQDVIEQLYTVGENNESSITYTIS